MLGTCPIAPPGGWGLQKPPPGVPIDRGHPLAAGLACRFDLNEGAGSRVRDSVCGSVGAIASTDLAAAWGAHPGVLSLSGTDEYVSLGSPTVLDFGLSDFSIAVRFRAAFGSPHDLQSLFAKSFYGVGAGRYGVGFQEDYLYVMATDANGYGILAQSPDIAYLDGQWHVVVGVWNRDASLQLWADGALVHENADLASYPEVSYTNSFPAVIGAYTGDIGFWSGSIDWVSVYRRALLADEIRQLHREPFCMFDGSLRCVTFAESEVLGPYRRDDAQVAVAGAVAGEDYHANATIGQDYNPGATIGFCNG